MILRLAMFGFWFVLLANNHAIAQTIDIERELFITDVSVVDHPTASNGDVWSFGGLFENLAGDNDPGFFLEQWIETLTNAQLVNNDPRGGLAASKDSVFQAFFDKWLLRSGGEKYDLANAPFRLTAIVNRPDLLKISDGVPSSAGELRFVFTAVNPLDSNPRKAITHGNLFIIFEFDVPVNTLAELKTWHESWHALAQHPLDSAAYRDALKSITTSITSPESPSIRVNGSRLNQLRSNEFSLPGGSTHWDLREWTLQANNVPLSKGLLKTDTTKQTPNFSFNDKPAKRELLRQWLDDNRQAILGDNHEIGTELDNGTAFLGSLAINDFILGTPPPLGPFGTNIQPNAAGTLWWAPTYANTAGSTVTLETADVRHKFALQTCSGCHHLETNNHQAGHPGFVMVSKREFGHESSLSGFLVGTGDFVDPVNPFARVGAGPATKRVFRNFNDLENRISIFSRILNLQISGPWQQFSIQELSAIQEAMGSRVH